MYQTQYYSDRHQARVEVMAARRTHRTLLSVFCNVLAVVGTFGIVFTVVSFALVGGQL